MVFLRMLQISLQGRRPSEGTGEERRSESPSPNGKRISWMEAEQELNFTSGEKVGTVDFSSETLAPFLRGLSGILKLS